MPSAAATTSRSRAATRRTGMGSASISPAEPYLHSIRFAYDRYTNNIEDAVAGANIFNPAPGLSLNFTGGSGFASGPNPQAPQETKQANLQARYDGTRTWQRHTFRFGVAVNKIDTLISANLFGLAPQVGSDTGADAVLFAATGPFAGGAGNPLNYPVNSITLGNGFSCFSEKSGFGSSCGGFSDTRMQAYLGDTWKVLPNLTVTIGVQYVRDSGRSNSDLPAIPCSAVAASYGSQAPCSGRWRPAHSFRRKLRAGRPGAPAQPELRSAVWPGLGPCQGWTNRRPRRDRHVLRQQCISATCWGIAWPGSRTDSSTPRPTIRAPATAWSFFPATLLRAPRACAGSPSEMWRPRSRICKLPSRRPMPRLRPALLTPATWDSRSTASRACSPPPTRLRVRCR